MPSFTKEQLSDIEDIIWNRKFDSAFAKKKELSDEDLIWLNQELTEVESEIDKLLENLRAARIWKKRIIRKLSKQNVYK